MMDGNCLARLWLDEKAISSVEYAVLLALITAGLVAAASGLGDATAQRYETAAVNITGAP